MVDIHAHILPGLDDGAQDMEEALQMAELAAAEGIRHMAASSHGNYYSYGLYEYKKALTELQKELQLCGIPIKLYPGMEIFLDEDALDLLNKNQLLTLNQTRYILAEFPFEESAKNVLRRLEQIKGAGYQAVIAHPERYGFVQREEELAYYLAEQGYLLQVNGGSLLGAFGKASLQLAWQLLEDGCVSVIATDSHDAWERPPRIREVMRQLQKKYPDARPHLWLSENPSRILKGYPVIRSNSE